MEGVTQLELFHVMLSEYLTSKGKLDGEMRRRVRQKGIRTQSDKIVSSKMATVKTALYQIKRIDVH